MAEGLYKRARKLRRAVAAVQPLLEAVQASGSWTRWGSVAAVQPLLEAVQATRWGLKRWFLDQTGLKTVVISSWPTH